MKQHQISIGLKGIVILLGVIGILFFGGVTFYVYGIKNDPDIGYEWNLIYFTWYIAVMCYGILFHFWHVCTQIGEDNSFSLENTRSFLMMSRFSLAIAVGCGVRLVVMVILIHPISLLAVAYSIFIILMAIVFWGICIALSKLVQNAYEVKLENELTI